MRSSAVVPRTKPKKSVLIWVLAPFCGDVIHSNQVVIFEWRVAKTPAEIKCLFVLPDHLKICGFLWSICDKWKGNTALPTYHTRQCQSNTAAFATRYLRKQVQVVQVSCHLHPTFLRLWDMDPAYWLREKDPGFRDQVPEETSPHLLLGAQDQWLGAEQEQPPCGLTGPLPASSVKRWKPAWFGHVMRQDSLSKTILQGSLEGGQCCSRQRNRWMEMSKSSFPA